LQFASAAKAVYKKNAYTAALKRCATQKQPQHQNFSNLPVDISPTLALKPF
jgi:hypothetical protein